MEVYAIMLSHVFTLEANIQTKQYIYIYIYILAFCKSLTHFYVLNAICVIIIRSFGYACSIVLSFAPF